MKSLREVCKTVGVTRRTLQEYNDIGLLAPSNTDRKPYEPWQYTDDAIKTLILIQMFIASGHERKDIKEMLSSQDFNLVDALCKAVNDFEIKSMQIVQQLHNLKLICFIVLNLKQAGLSIHESDLSLLFCKRSFNEQLRSADPIDTAFLESLNQLTPQTSACILEAIDRFNKQIQ